MNIQIIGNKKCNTTKKAVRFFKERNIAYHFLDLAEKDLSKGELENISRCIPLEDLMDTESRDYKKKGYAYLEFDPFEELLSNSGLLKTPIVRNGKRATVGDASDTWKDWVLHA